MPVRYRSSDEDSARWRDFALRAGDIVVSTRSKHGTTWMQTMLLLLIHGPPPLPAPLGELSPWIDHVVEPADDLFVRLAQQVHRRVVKTHTPLDGVPIDSRARYVVVARHPLDAAVSLYHQGDNLDRDRLAQLTGTSAPPSRKPRPPLSDWLSDWIDHVADPAEELDSLDGVLHHVKDAWSRRYDPNVVIVHYEDLRADLGAQMRALASFLDVAVAETQMEELVAAASFDSMRAQATQLAPDAHGVLRDARAFFRRGSSGEGAASVSESALERYDRRVADLAAPDLIAWLHR